ncbi:MAG: dihydroorotate dehydrogenase [Ruminococcaceae bacterium]|nr:dihydroorotate dehydrogenase [Oscillospiraceae bacterium]
MADMKVNIAGVEWNNPVCVASGTFGFGREYGEYFDLNELGAISVKGLTLKEREGNKAPRIAQTSGGILNSVGLQNPGVENFIKFELPELKKYSAKIIANIAGSTIEDYCQMAEILSDSDVDMLEMNISCPNVKEGGVAFGTDEGMVEKITGEVRKKAKKPLIVKLSPNVTDIVKMAKAAQRGGADALSLINTLLGMKIDINTKRPVLNNNVGGLSGPCVMPVAVRMVWQVANAVDLPIIGMGGIMSADDAAEFMLAGADAVMVGTGLFKNPTLPTLVSKGLCEYADKNGYASVTEITGKVVPN